MRIDPLVFHMYVHAKHWLDNQQTRQTMADAHGGLALWLARLVVPERIQKYFKPIINTRRIPKLRECAGSGAHREEEISNVRSKNASWSLNNIWRDQRYGETKLFTSASTRLNTDAQPERPKSQVLGRESQVISMAIITFRPCPSLFFHFFSFLF
jgi:hypothetical protein